eukprot:CAMPEP_0117572756 /NCGR_PEP_ID=MMETSP0784-20121206/60531_1 /TAXON_ID=39447 /ORGANISM="" /LENGTH=59 /DNA_ID=CAMNT_0005371157 /DNA_START=62 /DNA_END=238 /DNA_ORIENTATION=+
MTQHGTAAHVQRGALAHACHFSATANCHVNMQPEQAFAPNAQAALKMHRACSKVAGDFA